MNKLGKLNDIRDDFRCNFICEASINTGQSCRLRKNSRTKRQALLGAVEGILGAGQLIEDVRLESKMTTISKVRL